LRNGSGEQGWLRLRPWAHDVLVRIMRRSPAYLLAAIQDVSRNGPFVAGVVVPWLVNDWFSAYAWGHVRHAGRVWTAATWMLVSAALLGSVRALGSAQGALARARGAAFLFLFLAILSVSTVALLWPLTVQWGKVELPSARYLYVAAVPLALGFAGGWLGLWPRSYRGIAAGAWLAMLMAWNIAAILLIHGFYGR
jgi:hypothetical protein